MILSPLSLARLCLALGAALLLPAAAAAVPPYFRPIPNTYYGYETTLLQQAYYRSYEHAHSAAPPVAPPGTTYVTEHRYVTIIGPDNNARTFRQDVLRAVPPAPPARVPRFGANR